MPIRLLAKKRWPLVPILILLSVQTPRLLSAASLDFGTAYDLRWVSYNNLFLGAPTNNRTFLLQNAQLSAFVKDIRLPLGTYEDQTMDVGLTLRSVGVAGSSTALQVPFDSIAAHYPNSQFVPYIENAYVRLKQLFGEPLEATFGQQPFALGSGLLLSDDGVGLPGVSILGGLPFWNMKAGGFIFQPRNSQATPDSLTLFGATIELPTEGVWQLHQLVEKDRMPQTVLGTPIQKATRYFTGLRYQMNYGPFVFDGEAAIERGSGTPDPSAPPGTPKVTYSGNAQVLRAKWRQQLWKGGEDGIVRLVVARGSGDRGSTQGRNEAFFPSRGRRFNGLERSGFGDFFAATPYDAFGGRSSFTATGVSPGLSGIQTVGIGVTPPAFYGVAFDIDYFLFQADRNNLGPSRTLGSEYDLRLRYAVRDRFLFQTSMAIFRVGPALNPSKSTSRRFGVEVSGRF